MFLGFIARGVHRDRLWRDRLAKVWRRRPFAIVVVALYVGVALLDSVAWSEATSWAKTCWRGIRRAP